MLRKIIALTAVITIAAITGCAKKSEVSQVKNVSKPVIQKEVLPAVSKLKVTPATAKLVPGGTTLFTVTALDVNGKPLAVKVNWRVISDKAQIGVIDSAIGDKVLFTAKAAGKGQVEAEFNNVRTTASIEVFAKKK